MSTPLTSLPITIAIDYTLRTFTVSALSGDISVVRSSLAQALDQVILQLYKRHNELQDQTDDMLSTAGQNLKATVLEFGISNVPFAP
jgi:hypothetical protein